MKLHILDGFINNIVTVSVDEFGDGKRVKIPRTGVGRYFFLLSNDGAPITLGTVGPIGSGADLEIDEEGKNGGALLYAGKELQITKLTVTYHPNILSSGKW